MPDEAMKAGDADKQHQQEVEAKCQAQKLFCTAEAIEQHRLGAGSRLFAICFVACSLGRQVFSYLFSKPAQKPHVCIKGLGQSGYHGFAGGRPPVEHAQQLGGIDSRLRPQFMDIGVIVTHRVPMCWEKA
jgi:hypothetical protein